MVKVKAVVSDKDSGANQSILQESQKSINDVTNKQKIVTDKTFKDRKETVSLILCLHSQPWLRLSNIHYTPLRKMFCV